MGKYKNHYEYACEYAKRIEYDALLFWPKNKYLTTISGNEKTYNFNYAMALEIVGCIVKNEFKGNVSCCHMGVKYISNKLGVSVREVKSLKCSFLKGTRILNEECRYVYRIPYNAYIILNCIIDILENNKEKEIVKKFLKKNRNSQLYRTILIEREYMVVRDTYNRLTMEEREREAKLSDLYIKMLQMR